MPLVIGNDSAHGTDSVIQPVRAFESGTDFAITADDAYEYERVVKSIKALVTVGEKDGKITKAVAY